MIISAKGGGRDFAPCPEYTGRAVCVDVTPLKEYETQYGTKAKFKFAFEIDLQDDSRDPVQPWVVMTKPMVPSLHEKAALTAFLKDWFGRKLTDKETVGLDLETLIGRPCNVVIVHEQSQDGSRTYANIKLLTAHKTGEPLQPSGLWVRMQDRPQKEGTEGGTAPAKDSSYRKTQGAATSEDQDLSKTKVHVGRHKGIELRELTEEAIGALIDAWLPGAKANAKPTADDKRLIKALQWFDEKFKQAELDKANDELPY